MDWTQLLATAATAVVSTGLVAWLLAGRQGRARAALESEVELFKKLPADLPGTADFARELSVSLQEYWAPDPDDVTHRRVLGRWVALTVAVLGAAIWIAAIGFVLVDDPNAGPPTHAGTPVFWFWWGGLTVAVAGAAVGFLDHIVQGHALRVAERRRALRVASDGSGLSAELREVLGTPRIPLSIVTVPPPHEPDDSGGP